MGLFGKEIAVVEIPASRILKPALEEPANLPEPIVDKMVVPFNVTEIHHRVTLEGLAYDIRACGFDFLHSVFGSTFADVTISQGSRWTVTSRTLMLTCSGRNKASDCEGRVIGDFANAGLMVKRELITACLYPLAQQILQIEARLKTF
ncbi:MAG TPA: hypothetical protein VJG48_01475 [Candidatus Paceibacterota bacterium]